MTSGCANELASEWEAVQLTAKDSERLFWIMRWSTLELLRTSSIPRRIGLPTYKQWILESYKRDNKGPYPVHRFNRKQWRF